MPGYITSRREPKRDRTYGSRMGAFRRILNIDNGSVVAPEPVKYSGFFGIGKSPDHALSHKWFSPSEATDIPNKLAIMGWPFSVGKVPSALVVGMTGGSFNSQTNRVNVDSARPMAYGSMTALGAPLVTSPAYAKLM